MLAYIDKHSLQAFLDDLHLLTKVTVCFIDVDGTPIANAPKKGYCDYCKHLRSNSECNMECHISDIQGRIICQQKQQEHYYYCHAGLTEIICPIIYEKHTLGYMMLGEFLMADKKDSLKKDLLHISTKYNIDYPTLQSAYKKLPVYSKEEVKAIISITLKCSNELWLKSVFKPKKDYLLSSIELYVENNLHTPLTAEEICQKFYISKNKLYSLIKKEFKYSFKTYINNKKLKKAKDLLVYSTISIQTIAEEIGYKEYQSFLNFFKSHTGVTPMRYRKNQICE